MHSPKELTWSCNSSWYACSKKKSQGHETAACVHSPKKLTWSYDSSWYAWSKKVHMVMGQQPVCIVQRNSLGVRPTVGKAVEDPAATAEGSGEVSNHDVELLML